MVRDREAVRNSKTHNMIKEREIGQREKERESEREMDISLEKFFRNSRLV